MQKRMMNDFTEGNLVQKLFSYALPVAGANLLQTAFGLIDMAFVGNCVGDIALSAISVGNLLVQLFTISCMGFTNGCQIFLAQIVGKKDHKRLNDTIGCILTSLFVMAILLTCFGCFFSNFLLNLVNTPDKSFADTKVYFLTCCFGLVFTYGYNAVAAILKGMGESKKPLYFASIAFTVHLVLDIVLIWYGNLGVQGAAIATIAGHFVSFVYSLFYLYRRKEQLGFDFKKKSFLAIRKNTLGPIIRLGLPQAIQQFCVVLSFMYVNSQVNKLGVVASAVTGVGLNITSALNVFMNATGVSAANMIGQNFVVKKYDRVKKLVRLALIFNLCLITAFSIWAYHYPENLFSLFNQKPEVLALAREYIPYGIITYYAFAFMTPFNAVVTGVGNANLALFIGLMDGVVARIGLTYVFGNVLNMGLSGYWLGNGSAGYVSFLLASCYFFSGLWKKRKSVVD